MMDSIKGISSVKGAYFPAIDEKKRGILVEGPTMRKETKRAKMPPEMDQRTLSALFTLRSLCSLLVRSGEWMDLT